MWPVVGVHDGVHDVVRVIREASPAARPEQVRGNSKGKVAALETKLHIVMLTLFYSYGYRQLFIM